MKTTTIILLILFAIVMTFACVVLGGIATVKNVNNNLITLTETKNRNQANYSVALNIVAQKINGTFAILETYLDHESQIYKDLADARRRVDTAMSEGTPEDVAKATQAFQLKVDALVEDNPEIASALLADNTRDALEEAVNEIATAAYDLQESIKAYNEYRQQLWAPKIVGDFLGFPSSYDYFEGDVQKLNVDELLNK